MIQRTIVVIDDDKDIQSYVRQFLTDQGFVTHSAGDGIEGMKLIEKVEPDLVILDLGLPNVTGETVCDEIKKNYTSIPVIMLTAKDTAADIAKGLNLGADDYITKPFDSSELLARVRARLRDPNNQNNQLVVNDLVLDTKSLRVKRGNEEIHLTPQEFKILAYLMSNKEMVVSREMILSRLWRTNPDVETRVVDVYIGYLRKKIDKPGLSPLIHSVRGFGYRIGDIHD